MGLRRDHPLPTLPGRRRAAAPAAGHRGSGRMAASDGFSGQMCDVPGLIFNFTYSTFETRTRTSTDGQGHMTTETYTEEVKHRHTVLRLEVGAVAGVDTVQLADRGIGFLNKL